VNAPQIPIQLAEGSCVDYRRVMRHGLGLFLITFAGCAGRSASRAQPAECRESPPRGTPSQLTMQVHAATGPDIDAPVMCGTDAGFATGAYVRVHARGTRRFAFGDSQTACKTPPGPDTTAAACPEIDFDAFNWAVYRRLRERGIADAEVGMGVCGEVNGVADDFRMSASVHDWKQADLATAVVAEELARWGIGGSFGVSIRGQSCVTLTAGR
jgi:hypothetical protein